MKRDRLPKSLADAPPLNRADDHRNDLTDAERMDRMCIAVHEAAHLVAACRVRQHVLSAFVRVPRKQPKAGYGGSLGQLYTAGTLGQGAVVAAAGIAAQKFLPTDNDCKDDWEYVYAWTKWTGDGERGPLEPFSLEREHEFLDAVLLMVRDNWEVIDAVAACLLHCADATGVLSPALTSDLSALVRSTHPCMSRTPEFPGPAAVCEKLRMYGPQICTSRDYPYVRVSAPPNYLSPRLTWP